MTHVLDTHDLDPILDKIGKLLALAAKAGTPAEAEAAALKAQELMDRYNLDTVALEKRTGATSGKREEAMVTGGFYSYQRNLFTHLAKLNFCMYFAEEYRAELERSYSRVSASTGRTLYYEKGQKRWKTRHRLVGRIVNVRVTQHMAVYLMNAVNRELRERVRKSDGTIGVGVMMSSWAVSFREGAVARLVDKIADERRKGETKRAADAKRAAKFAGHSTATALTLQDVAKTEEQANYDFLNGDGAWAKRMKHREDDAREYRAHLDEIARRAAEDPEYAKELEKKRRIAARASGPGSRGGTSHLGKVSDYSAYNAGFDAAEKISLNQQATTDRPTAMIGRSK